MKAIIGLTFLFLSTTISALEPYKVPDTKAKIGEEHIERKIAGSMDDHYLVGCDTKGFHLAAEKYKGAYQFHMYCGPAPKNTTHYLIKKEPGI